MAHYAYLDKDNIVLQVITGKDESEIVSLPKGFTSWEDFYLTHNKDAKKCIRTSYNTFQNKHLLGGTPFRGNFAGVGMIYDVDEDVFYLQQPFASWTLNKNNWTWEPPVAIPDDAFDSEGDLLKNYEWDESSKNWAEITES